MNRSSRYPQNEPGTEGFGMRRRSTFLSIPCPAPVSQVVVAIETMVEEYEERG
jgi:hypothetical protein